MMNCLKTLLCFFIILINAPMVFSQAIEDLTLDKEVMLFIRKECKSLKNFNLGIKAPKDENQWYLDSISYSPWYVGDFNKDGLSDLFITGMDKKTAASYLILAREVDPTEIAQPVVKKRDKPKKTRKPKKKNKEESKEEEEESEEFTNDAEEEEEEKESIFEEPEAEEETVEEPVFTEPGMSYEILEVKPTKMRGAFVVPYVEESIKEPLVIFKQFAVEQKVRMKSGVESRYPKSFNEYFQMGMLRKDTLVYKFNGLVEYNSKPTQKKIKFIQMHSYCQFGGCPDFKLKIDSNGAMILQNIKNTNEENGVRKTYCQKDFIQLITELSNYLVIPNKDKSYGDKSADEVITLQIVFADQSYIKVIDYSLGGTLGLFRMYDLLYEIKSKVEWQ